MIQENTRLLFKLYFRPLAGRAEIIDKGSWLYAAVLVALVSVLFQYSVTSRIYGSLQAAPITTPQRAPYGPGNRSSEEEGASRHLPLPVVGNLAWRFISFSPSAIWASVFTLALLYTPLTLLVANLFEHWGSFGVVLQRDYGALLACTLMGWAAAHLPFSLLGLALDAARPDPRFALALWSLSKLFFAASMVAALRTVFGASLGSSIGTVCISWVSVIFESSLVFLASPFILYWGYRYLQGDIGDILRGFRTGQSFRRHLEAATVNPHDAEAHYQLDLIHQQRRQYTDAVARFKRAVEIDPTEFDAHFQLGRIARTQGRLEEALEHFKAVVTRDDDHAQSEIWREIGATYAAASRNEEARAALERHVERRPYDPEGLYYLGQVLANFDQTGQAREVLERSVEAEKTNPYSRHGHLRKWRKLAEKLLRTLPLTVKRVD